MATATINGTILAESNDTIEVEGNHYFPLHAIKQEYFTESNLHTTCGWKGVANYYHLEIDGQKLENAAWYYPQPKEAANNIQNYIAFYGNKVQVTG